MQDIHAIYVRVSNESQVEKESIDTQIKMGTDRIISKFGNDAKIERYVDGGFTGRNTNRVAFQKLLTDIKNKKIHTVYVFKLDRLARNTKEQLNIYDDYFKATRTNLVSLTQDFDTSTPAGTMMFQMLAVVAEMESSNTSERIRAVFKRFAEEGEAIHGRAPYGYKSVKRQFVIVPEEAEIIRGIFEMLSTGKYTQIDVANHFGVLQTTVYKWINNKVYLGMHVHKGEYYPGKHEPIISQELFDTVHKNIRTFSKKRKYIHPFSGIVFCHHCGGRYNPSARTLKRNNKFECLYYCNNKVNKQNKPATCDNRGEIMEKKIENYFLEQLDEVLNKYVVQIKKPAKRKLRAQNNDTRIAILTKKNDRLIDLYTDELITLEQFTERQNKLLEEIEQLQIKKANEKTPAPKVSAAYLKDVSVIYPLATREEKKKLINALVKKIMIKEKTPIAIEWVFELE